MNWNMMNCKRSLSFEKKIIDYIDIRGILTKIELNDKQTDKQNIEY